MDTTDRRGVGALPRGFAAREISSWEIHRRLEKRGMTWADLAERVNVPERELRLAVAVPRPIAARIAVELDATIADIALGRLHGAPYTVPGPGRGAGFSPSKSLVSERAAYAGLSYGDWEIDFEDLAHQPHQPPSRPHWPSAYGLQEGDH